MKAGRLVLLLVFASISAWWSSVSGQTSDSVVLDMRHGLSESRIRQIRQMPDGRMAIATTNTIDIFDGTRFTGYELSPDKAYPLPDFHGERQLTCDSLGYVWLRYKRKLYVLDTQRGEVTDDVPQLMKKRNLTDADVAGWPTDTIPSHASGRKVTCYAEDYYGGTWKGTQERGIIYSHPRRTRQFHTFADSVYIHPRQPDYRTPHASQLASAHAAGITNCSLDLGGNYVFIGTRRGLMVFGSDDSPVATLDDRDGLASSNVQAITDDGHGDVWIATTTGLSRIHAQGRDTFDITSYGVLDGIKIDGSEFRTGQMHVNDDGSVCVGYGGGVVVFHPDSVSVPCYTYHYPRAETTADGNDKRNVWPVITVPAGLLLCLLLFLYKTKRLRTGKTKTTKVNEAKHSKATNISSDETIDRLRGVPADEHFMQRLKEIIEANISDEDFSVQTLSELMAMDRTGLYRRMQQLTDMPPSNYIKQIRMDVAARLLRESDLPVADVAIKTGFSSTKYFSKVFKEHFGCSPTDFRSQG